MVVRFMMKLQQIKKINTIISLQNQISSTAISSKLVETIGIQLLSREVWPEVEELQCTGVVNAEKYIMENYQGRCMIGPKFIP